MTRCHSAIMICLRLLGSKTGDLLFLYPEYALKAHGGKTLQKWVFIKFSKAPFKCIIALDKRRQWTLSGECLWKPAASTGQQQTECWVFNMDFFWAGKARCSLQLSYVPPGLCEKSRQCLIAMTKLHGKTRWHRRQRCRPLPGNLGVEENARVLLSPRSFKKSFTSNYTSTSPFHHQVMQKNKRKCYTRETWWQMH